MKPKRIAASMIVVFLVCFFVGANGARVAHAIRQPQPTAQSPVDRAIEQAFSEASQASEEFLPSLLVYDVAIDTIQYSEDGRTALLWLVMRDRQTGETLETEPGLSVARFTGAAITSGSSWSIVLPTGAGWLEQLQALPPELLTEDVRNHVLVSESPDPALLASGVFTGYRLPWAAGLSKRVTNTIGHVMSVSGGLTSCPATCRYAYDFADGTMFPILAARGGTIKSYRTTCANGDSNCTNYLVLEDQSTIPTSYQLYYHMAYNSVPQRLRQVGVPVLQGEYLGDADDTGFSTGHHLHFHVFTSPNSANWSWGPSVNFAFDDVTTNDGYPRTCAEAAAYPKLGAQCMTGNRYVSGNAPAHPPSAVLSAPADQQMITTRTMRVAGSAIDDIAISRIQVQANYDGTWQTIDDITPPPGLGGAFAKDVDLCAAKVPDGPFALLVNIFDREGSRAAGIPVLQVIKAASCASTGAAPHALIIAAPAEGQKLPVQLTVVAAAAMDADGGEVAQVDFFWHSGDWSQPAWKKLGSDVDGKNGWSVPVNPSQLGVLEDSAIYVQALGKRGGVLGAARWHLSVDTVTPASQLQPLPAQINSTAVRLDWIVQDLQNDIARFDFQYQVNTGGAWSGWYDWGQAVAASARSVYFLGVPGTSLRFRMRAVDRAGNAEAYPAEWEAVTTLAAACAPDARESQNTTLETSLPVRELTPSPRFNLCRAGQTGADDVDWLALDAEAGQTHYLLVVPRGGGAAFRVRLYDPARQELASWSSASYDQQVFTRWTAPATGTYFLEVRPIQPELFGTDTMYQVYYSSVSRMYFPYFTQP